MTFRFKPPNGTRTFGIPDPKLPIFSIPSRIPKGHIFSSRPEVFLFIPYRTDLSRLVFTHTDPIVIDPDVNSESEKEAIKKTNNRSWVYSHAENPYLYRGPQFDA